MPGLMLALESPSSSLFFVHFLISGSLPSLIHPSASHNRPPRPGKISACGCVPDFEQLRSSEREWLGAMRDIVEGRLAATGAFSPLSKETRIPATPHAPTLATLSASASRGSFQRARFGPRALLCGSPATSPLRLAPPRSSTCSRATMCMRELDGQGASAWLTGRCGAHALGISERGWRGPAGRSGRRRIFPLW